VSQENRTEEIASAIEDLLYMGAIRITEDNNKAVVSPQFALIATNIMESSRLSAAANSRDDVMKLMYYSLLIYMNEHLKIPKSLAVAIGNDMEKHRQEMESGELVTTYVAVLSEIWSQSRREMEGQKGGSSNKDRDNT
jgi:hypothetical protein